MSIVKINAIEVPEGMGEALEKRFAARASEVDKMPGFEAFELLRPVEGENRYFVYTRWESEEAHSQWTKSESFKQAHSGPPADFILGHGEFSSYQVRMSVAPEG